MRALQKKSEIKQEKNAKKSCLKNSDRPKLETCTPHTIFLLRPPENENTFFSATFELCHSWLVYEKNVRNYLNNGKFKRKQMILFWYCLHGSYNSFVLCERHEDKPETHFDVEAEKKAVDCIAAGNENVFRSPNCIPQRWCICNTLFHGCGKVSKQQKRKLWSVVLWQPRLKYRKKCQWQKHNFYHLYTMKSRNVKTKFLIYNSIFNNIFVRSCVSENWE